MKVVCHVQLFSELSGVQNVSLDEFRVSLERGERIQYHLICKEDGEFPRAAKALGVKVHYVPSLIRELSLKSDLISFFAIYKILRKIKCCAVHTHSSKTGFLGRMAARMAGVQRVVHTVHGFGFPAAKNSLSRLIFVFVEFFAARITDATIVMNMSDYNFSYRRLLINRRKLHLISNSCRYDLLTITDEPIKPDLNIAFVGRLTKQKNPSLAIDAFEKLLQFEKFKNARLFVIGDGDLSPLLMEKVVHLKIDGSVVFCGWSSEVSDILQTCQILLASSDWEGFPLVVAEAASVGCIPLMTNVSGYRELHEHHRIGFLANKEDYGSAFVRLCTYIVDDQNFYRAAKYNLTHGLKSLPSSFQRFNWVVKLYETDH